MNHNSSGPEVYTPNAQEKLTTIQEDLEQVKNAVESEEKIDDAKKEEIQKTITKTQYEIDNLENDATLSTEEKKTLEGSKDELANLKKKLESENTLLDKAGNFVKENKKWFLAGGIGVGAVLLRRSLFGKKEKKEGNDSIEKKKPRWKKALLWGAGIFGGIMLRKHWGDIMDRFNGGKKENPDVGDGLKDIEDANKQFEKLESGEKEKYTKYGNTVNIFFDDIYKFNDGTVPAGLQETKLGGTTLDKDPGVIPAMLDGSFGSIDAMLSQKGLFSLDTTADANEVAKKIAGLVGGGAGKIASWILGCLGFEGIIKPGNIEKDVREFLTGKNKLEDAKLIFRKILKTITYTQYAKNVYVGQAVEKLLQHNGKLYEKGRPTRENTETWELLTYTPGDTKLLDKIIHHPDHYKIDETSVKNILGELQSDNIRGFADSFAALDTKELWKYNSGTKKQLDTINTDRDKVHESLAKDKNKTLETLKENVADELAGSMRFNIQRTMPILFLTDIFAGDNTAQIEELKKNAGFQQTLSQFKGTFEKLKGENDINVVKKTIDDYYATLKEISMAEAATDQIIDENGNVGVRIFYSIKNVIGYSWENIEYGFALIGEAFADGDIGLGLEGGFYVATGTAPFLLLHKSGRKLLCRTGGKIGKFAFKTTLGTTKVLGKQAGAYVMHMLPSYMLRNAYFSGVKGAELLQYYYLTGQISTQQASKVVSHEGWKHQAKANRYKSIFDYLHRNSFIYDTDKVFLENAASNGRYYMDNPSVRKLLFDKVSPQNIKNKILNPKSMSTFDLNRSVMDALQDIDKRIVQGGEKADLFKKILQQAHFKDVDTIKNLAANMDNITNDMLKGSDLRGVANKIVSNFDILVDPHGLKNMLSELAPEKNIVKLISNDIAKLTSQAKLPPKMMRNGLYDAQGNKIMKDANETARNLAKSQIDELTSISKTLEANKALYHIDDLRIIEKIYSSGLDNPKQIAAIIDAISHDNKIVPALLKGDLSLLKTSLHSLGYTKFFGNASNSLDAPLTKVLSQFDPQIFKLVGSFGGDALKVFGKFLKIVL